VIPRPSRILRSKSGPPTDHNPIVLHLSLLIKSATQSTADIPLAQKASSTNLISFIQTERLSVRKKFSHALEDQADKVEQAIQTFKNSLQQGSINATQYAEKANAIIVSALQVTAKKIIGTTEFQGKNARKEHLTQRRQQDNGHRGFSSDDKRIVAKQTLTQTLKNKLSQAREEGVPAHVIAGLGKSHAKKKHELLKLQHQIRQKIVTGAVASSASVPTHQRTSFHSMWDLLRRYKTDHVQSNLPAHTHDNASPDPRIWK